MCSALSWTSTHNGYFRVELWRYGTFSTRMYESIALEKNKKAVTEALNRRDSAFSDGRTAIDSNVVKSNSKL